MAFASFIFARTARFGRGVPAGIADSGPRVKPRPVGTVIVDPLASIELREEQLHRWHP